MYLITYENGEPFFTPSFDCEAQFNNTLNMVVYDLQAEQYTTDGVIWQTIKYDHL